MRKNTELLTEKIANDYYKRAKKISNTCLDIGERRELRIELQERCGVTEIEAINILNGFHTKDYIAKYQRLEKGIYIDRKTVEDNEPEEKIRELTDKNYDDWLLQRLIELQGEKE